MPNLITNGTSPIRKIIASSNPRIPIIPPTWYTGIDKKKPGKYR